MRWNVLAALTVLALSGCAAPVHPYAGSPGSVYDKESGPPYAVPTGGYDAMKPITPHDFGNGGSPAPA